MTWSMVTTPTMRSTPAAEEHLAAGGVEATGDPVGVADRDGGDDGVAVEAVPQAVADPLAGGDGLHERDRRRPGEGAGRRSATSAWSARAGRGRDAVDGDAGADEVVARRGVAQRGRGVGGVARDRGRMPRPARSARTASNRASWSAVYGSPGSSATAQWVHTDASSSAGSRTTASARATASVGLAPTRCMPVSTLRCTASRWPRSAAALAAAVDPACGVDGGLEAERRRTRPSRRARLGEDEGAGGDPVVAEQGPLGDDGDGEPRLRRRRAAAAATGEAPWP